ncbi:MAG TPA: UDP-2,4-diacetamido-2,4,6-trideoxy-beta-L-altropyranose hydrolase [Steroidobacteraceae bacterium]|nr:UDP-2,4-diacetamido-2,4,6-trideoxy-beta-L-altropyranose hydrolase [Steroidobacteraceae bacterium]
MARDQRAGCGKSLGPQPVIGGLVLRCDATPTMGAGHLMRCLALGQAWVARGGRILVVKAPEMPSLESRIVDCGGLVDVVDAAPGSIEDARFTVAAATAFAARCVVVDGYHFGSGYHRAIVDAQLRLALIDDLGGQQVWGADVVINQNIYAVSTLYPYRDERTKLLLGTKFALLRREFCRWADAASPRGHSLRRLLITLGGSDPENVTLKVMQGLALMPRLPEQVVVVSGPGNPHLSTLQSAAERAGGRFKILTDVLDMARLMTECGAAVSGAGSTTWELAFMGLPAALLVLAENQRGIAEGMAAEGAAVNLGWHHLLSASDLATMIAEWLSDEPRLRRMSARGRELVDGMGAMRVVDALLELGA